MRTLIIAIVLATVAAACSSSDDQADTTPTTAPTPGSTTAATAAPAPVEDEAVSFPTGDGLTLEGRRFGSGPTGVVLAHMRPASMESWFEFAEILAESGYSALAFNFRGYGNSEGAGFAVDVDTTAAVDFLQSTGVTEVFAIGASMGGTGAVAAAAERAVGGVATLSAPDRFEGTDAIDAARAYAGPLLLIAAEDDQPYAAEATAIAAAAAGPARVEILPGQAHGTGLFATHPAEVIDLLLEFLATNA